MKDEIKSIRAADEVARAKLTAFTQKWVQSIDDVDVKVAVLSDAYITGGAVASVLQGEAPRDYDFYFRTPEKLELVVKYYLRRGVSDGKPGGPFDLICITNNAITLVGGLQIVRRDVGNPFTVVHKTFDFLHSMGVYHVDTEEIEVTREALRYIRNKELFYQAAPYPVGSLFRLKRFVARGYKIAMPQMLKLCFSIAALRLSNLEVLRDQLCGYYGKFSKQLVKAIGDDYIAGTLTIPEVMELIDKIFGRLQDERITTVAPPSKEVITNDSHR